MPDGIKLPVPVGSTFTMEALVPGGIEKAHATLSVHLPGGTKLYTADQLRAAVLADRQALTALIADDAFATTFQSLGGYRSALLEALRQAGGRDHG